MLDNLIISIIMPTYNRAWCIERAINSVLSQDNSNWQLVIVDDGSTDGTDGIIKKYLDDKRIKYYYQDNQGVNRARNKGIELADCDFITLLDSDDEFLPCAIQTIINDIHLLENNLSAILYKRKDYKSNKEVSNEIEESEISYIDALQNRWPKYETVAVFRKSLFDIIKFPDFKGGGEAYFWMSCLKEIGPVLRKKDVLGIYHTEHTNRLTGGEQIFARAESMVNFYDQYLIKFKEDLIKYNKSKYGLYYYNKAVFEILIGKMTEARRSLMSGYKFKKNILIFITLFIVSFFPKKIMKIIMKFGYRFKEVFHE